MKINKRLILSAITIATTAFMLGGCGNTTKNANSVTNANKATATKVNKTVKKVKHEDILKGVKFTNIDKNEAKEYAEFTKEYVLADFSTSNYKTETIKSNTDFFNKYYDEKLANAEIQNVQKGVQSDQNQQIITKPVGVKITKIEKSKDDSQKDIIVVDGNLTADILHSLDKSINKKEANVTFTVYVQKINNQSKVVGFKFSKFNPVKDLK